MSSDTWADLGAGTFLICILVILIGFIMFIASSYNKATERKQRIRSTAKKMLLFGLIGAIIGFGVCANNFTLILN